MMRSRIWDRKWNACVAGALLLLAAATSHATNNLDCSSGKNGSSKLLRVVGLTDDGALVCFSEITPRRVRDIGYVNGLVAPDVRLIGIDFRVQDGALYGVGNGGGVYRLDTSNATATLVNVLTVALDGKSFGVDFNPAADRLRIVSDTGQNLRHNVNMGGTTIADLALNYTPGTNATGIVGAAYTNNDLDAQTATTLFDLDTNLDQVAIQAPPNNGSLNPTGMTTVDSGSAAGFDIYSDLRNAVTSSNRGYAVQSFGSASAFYRVSLTTGKSQFIGVFRRPVVDIAVPLNQ